MIDDTVYLASHLLVEYNKDDPINDSKYLQLELTNPDYEVVYSQDLVSFFIPVEKFTHFMHMLYMEELIGTKVIFDGYMNFTTDIGSFNSQRVRLTQLTD